MAIIAECPVCHKKQKVTKKICACGIDLDKEKKAKKVRYHVIYRINGKQKWLSVGSVEGCKPHSLDDARAIESKYMVSKKENRIDIFDVRPDAKMTFNELSERYLNLDWVKKKKYYPTLTYNLKSFNAELGNFIVSKITVSDIENYKAKRRKAGYSDSYIDQEVGAAKTVINEAFENNMVGGNVVKTFKKVKKLLKRNANARKRILNKEEFDALMTYLPHHTKLTLAIGFHTGMRLGEVLSLTLDKVNLKDRVINLDAKDTKDGESREIPICNALYKILLAESNPIRDAKQDNHVILYKGKPIKDIRGALKIACRKAGIQYGRNQKNGFTYHDLRHTFNTNMRKAGVHDTIIMEITGHSTREMFDRYNTIDANDTLEAVKQYGDYIKGVR